MATVGKKFIDPEIWEAPFFTRLTPEQKQLWLYMWIRCDHIGVITFIPTIWGAYIGNTITNEILEDYIQTVNHDRERMVKLTSEKLWIPDYLKEQQNITTLNPHDKFHKNILSRIKGHEMHDQVERFYPNLLKNIGQEGPSRVLHSPLSKGKSGKGSEKGEEVINSRREIFPITTPSADSEKIVQSFRDFSP